MHKRAGKMVIYYVAVESTVSTSPLTWPIQVFKRLPFTKISSHENAVIRKRHYGGLRSSSLE